MKDAETSLGLAAVVPKDCSQCVHCVQFNLLVCTSFSYSVALEAVPYPVRQGWKTDFLGGREEGVWVCFLKSEWSIVLSSNSPFKMVWAARMVTELCRV